MFTSAQRELFSFGTLMLKVLTVATFWFALAYLLAAFGIPPYVTLILASASGFILGFATA